MYLSVIFLPLISFFLCISLGHFFGEKGSFYCAISLMSLATFFALFINFEIIYFNSNCFIETID